MNQGVKGVIDKYETFRNNILSISLEIEKSNFMVII
jgi:hypothetical protein